MRSSAISSQNADDSPRVAGRPWFALEERHAALTLGRVAVAVAAGIAAIAAPLDASADGRVLAVAACAAALLAHAGLAWLPRARPERLRLAVDAGLLVDALLVAALAALSGGVDSPALWLLPFLTLAATLAVSPRTGVKAGALGVLVVVGLQVRDGAETVLTADTGRWVAIIVALAGTAAAFSAVNERELRRRGARLGVLQETTRALVEAGDEAALGEVARRGAEALLPGWSVRVRTDAAPVEESAWREGGEGHLVVPVSAHEAPDRPPRPFGCITARRPAPRAGRIRVRRSTILALRTLASSYGAALERLELVRRLEHLSSVDPLTGLGNRRAFEEALDMELARARRTGRPVGLLLLDIDHFKRVNDEHGHAAGDEVLAMVGRVMDRHARVEDRACRIGGEEFAVLLPGADLAAGREVAERLRRAIAAERMPTGGVTVSAGVAASDGVPDPTRLVEEADARLYVAKAEGRDRVVAETRPTGAGAAR